LKFYCAARIDGYTPVNTTAVIRTARTTERFERDAQTL